MTGTILVAALGAAGALAARAAIAYMAEQLRGVVVVTTRQGDSYRGRRRLTVRRAVVLEAPEALGPEVAALGGRIEIPAGNVALLQQIEGER